MPFSKVCSILKIVRTVFAAYGGVESPPRKFGKVENLIANNFNMNQKGFVNIILIVLVVVFASAVGYFVLIKKPVSTEQPKSDNLSDTQSTAPTPMPAEIKISEGIGSESIENQKKSIVFDPYKIKAGDMAGNFKVSNAKYEKFPSGNLANFEVKFAGEGTITGKIIGISDTTGSFCFQAIDALSRDLLPRMKNENVIASSVFFCFSNRDLAIQQLKNKSTATINVSDFTSKFIIPDDYPNRAKLVKVIKSE